VVILSGIIWGSDVVAEHSKAEIVKEKKVKQ